MKQVIIILSALFIGFLLLAQHTDAAAKLLKATEFATAGLGQDSVTVYKVVDGTTTCYVSRHGKFGAHAISCVK